MIELDNHLLAPESPARGSAWRWRAVVVLLAVAALHRVGSFDFGGWDDELNIVANSWLNPPSWSGVLRYWRAPAFDLYVPVTYTTWSGLAVIAYDMPSGRLNPHVFHVANLVLHASASVFVFESLRQVFSGATIGSGIAAACGAMLFAVHPVQVEPVAWVAGMKDVQGGALAAASLALILYALKSERQLRIAPYAAATALFAMALLSKPSAVTMPAVAWLLARVASRRSLTNLSLVLIPWFALGLACAIMTRMFQPAHAVAAATTLPQRLVVAVDTLGFYLAKIAIPVRLGVDYGRTPQHVLATDKWVGSTLLVVAVFAACAVAWVRYRTSWPVVALATIVLALLPVLGLVAFDFQAYSTVADHYLYLPMIGVALLFGWIVLCLRRSMALSLSVVVIGSCVVLSWRQAGHWCDGFAVARRAIDVNPRSFAWQDRMATLLLSQSRPEEAVEHSRKAVEARPDFAMGWLNLGVALSTLHRDAEAGDAYRRSIEFGPTDARPRVGLGNSLANLGQFTEAIDAYHGALSVAPGDVNALSNLAAALAESGRLTEAVERYMQALRIDPSHSSARVGLARVRAELAAAKRPPASSPVPREADQRQ